MGMGEGIGRTVASTLALAALACGPQRDEEPWPGVEIAYQSGRELHLIDRAVTFDRTVAAALHASTPLAWSPDARRIAYAYGDTLYATDAVQEQELADLKIDWIGSDTTAIAWAASGDWLALTRYGYSWAPQCLDRKAFVVVRVDLDADDGECEVCPVATEVDEAALAPAPDHDAIAFASDGVVCGDDGVPWSPGWDVRILAGRCSAGTTPFSRYDGDEWIGAWSPDGRRLAVNVGSKLGPPGSAQIQLWDVDDGSAKPLTSGACSHRDLAWFPDGARLLARRECPDAPVELVVVDANTGDVDQSLPDLGDSVSISLDGEHLLYVTADEPSRIAVRDVADGTTEVLAEGTGPVWRPSP